MSRLCILILTLCTLSACATHYGTPAIQDYGRYLTLQPGVSTKHDIYDRFGQPHDVRGTATGSEWIYLKANARINGASYVPFVGVLAGGQTIESMQARIRFDAEGRYTGVETTQARKYANSWVEVAHQLQSLKDPAHRVQTEMVHLQLPFDGDLAKKIAPMQKSSGVPHGS